MDDFFNSLPNPEANYLSQTGQGAGGYQHYRMCPSPHLPIEECFFCSVRMRGVSASPPLVPYTQQAQPQQEQMQSSGMTYAQVVASPNQPQAAAPYRMPPAAQYAPAHITRQDQTTVPNAIHDNTLGLQYNNAGLQQLTQPLQSRMGATNGALAFASLPNFKPTYAQAAQHLAPGQHLQYQQRPAPIAPTQSGYPLPSPQNPTNNAISASPPINNTQFSTLQGQLQRSYTRQASGPRHANQRQQRSASQVSYNSTNLSQLREGIATSFAQHENYANASSVPAMLQGTEWGGHRAPFAPSTDDGYSSLPNTPGNRSTTSSQQSARRRGDEMRDPSLEYQCQHNLCGCTFAREDALRHHTRRVHGERAHPCRVQQCQYSGVDPKDLYRHQRIKHWQILGLPAPKIYYCPVCGNGIKGRRDNLTRHIKNAHQQDSGIGSQDMSRGSSFQSNYTGS